MVLKLVESGASGVRSRQGSAKAGAPLRLVSVGASSAASVAIMLVLMAASPAPGILPAAAKRLMLKTSRRRRCGLRVSASAGAWAHAAGFVPQSSALICSRGPRSNSVSVVGVDRRADRRRFVGGMLRTFATLEDGGPLSTSPQTDGTAYASEQRRHDYPVPTADNWRSHPLLHETHTLPALVVPSEHLHTLMRGELKNYLATGMVELEGVHPRVKAVVDAPERQQDMPSGDEKKEARKRKKGKGEKMILLNPSLTVPAETSPPLPDGHLDFWTSDDDANAGDNIANGDDADEDEDGDGDACDFATRERWRLLRRTLPRLPRRLTLALARLGARPGPYHTLGVPPSHQTTSRILSKLLPAEALPPPSGYEQIGHVIHLNLKERHLPHAELIGSVLLDRTPGCRTVVDKDGEVGGPFRTYKMTLLGGEPVTRVKVVEHGARLEFDLAKVYWCSRLSGERSRMIEEDFEDGDLVADAFCGAGALCVQAALKRGCCIVANDLNPDAVEYCLDNARSNGVEGVVRTRGRPEGKRKGSCGHRRGFEVGCGDARDFIARLGLAEAELEGGSNDSDAGEGKKGDGALLPHHLVLNFPLASPDFLGALRWWDSSAYVGSDDNHDGKAGGGAARTRVHVYTFARGDGPNDTAEEPRSPLEVAVDMVTDGLFPKSSVSRAMRHRQSYLDSMGCNVRTREVRDVAPGKVVVLVSFDVTAELLRNMQWDY